MSTKYVVLKKQSKIPLLVHGQGVFIFESDSPCRIFIFDADNTSGLNIYFTSKNVHVTEILTNVPLIDPYNSSGITNKKGAYYWFSIDSQNQTLCAGIGEARMETMIYQYKFPEDVRKESKEFLEELVRIYVPKESKSVKPRRLLRDPITEYIPLLVKNTDDLTMNDIAKATFLPKSTLSSVSQQMYDCISGKKFILNDKDFPEFSKAIQHSIVTPGLWCYRTLQRKATEFGDKPNLDETYIRITLGQNNGESPGIPYVMEIWPIGHYSPIHSHSEADAIIRVLHGSINVTLYPYLCYDNDGIRPFGHADFNKDDITWISPTLNQTHQLKNVSNDVCVTIQCYMYEQDDKAHYDYFDYLDANGDKKQYEPDSDMDFTTFKDLMLLEFTTRNEYVF
jgi:uncharacterized cupin superfamily protein